MIACVCWHSTLYKLAGKSIWSFIIASVQHINKMVHYNLISSTPSIMLALCLGLLVACHALNQLGPSCIAYNKANSYVH